MIIIVVKIALLKKGRRLSPGAQSQVQQSNWLPKLRCSIVCHHSV